MQPRPTKTPKPAHPSVDAENTERSTITQRDPEETPSGRTRVMPKQVRTGERELHNNNFNTD